MPFCVRPTNLFIINLSGETRKIETDRVAVGTFSSEGLFPVSSEGLFPVFQERFPWSIIDKNQQSQKTQESIRRLKKNTVAVRLPPTVLQKACDTRLCLGVGQQACVKIAMRKCSHVYQLWSHSYTHWVKITGLHVVTNPLIKQILERCGRYYEESTSRYNGYPP